jgi:group I intron endonuclease
MGKILYVYRITNLLNNKIYIGKHSSDRLDDLYYGSGYAIKKSIKKYGKNNFKKEVICICKSEKEWNEKEIFYIKKENSFINGYNMTKGGEGKLGFIQSLESIEKSSISRKKYYKNHPEARKYLSDLAKKRTGKNNSFFGKKLSENHIIKMTEARIKAIRGSNNPSARKLLCIEKNKEFSTAKEASIFCGLSSSTTILKAAKGQRKTAGGYTWKLLN